MSLGLPTGGNYNPYIAWLASERKFVVKGEDGSKAEKAVDEVVIDFDNLKKGWGLIQEGQAPQWQWLAEGEGFNGAPDDRGWKAGIGVVFFFADDGVFDFDTNATGAVMGIDEAHDKYLAGLDANKGKVPVFKLTGARAARVGKGNTAIPEFDLVKWIDRPEGLDADTAEAAPIQQVAAGGSQF